MAAAILVGGTGAPPGGAAAPPAAPATTFGLGGSATMIDARIMDTESWQQRRIKSRSVNSFMAFRCKCFSPSGRLSNNWAAYYSHIFKMQQKVASAHVKNLWEKDTFKAKWVIIAKAFSTIRIDLGVHDAPLDKFLTLICPAVGIIAAAEYLEKMKWEIVTATDGTIRLQQTSAPDISSFQEQSIFNTVSEWDLIALAIANDYFAPGTVLQNASLAQHGVFSAAPAHQPAQQPAQQPQNTQQSPQTFATRVDFFRSVATNPIATASAVLGFDVGDMLRVSDNQPLEWTGSLADLYNPETGFYDIERSLDDPFIIGNINEPLGFDNIFNDSVRDGYSIPAGKFRIPSSNIRPLTFVVPDFDGEHPNYM
jgi:hypothetical protein